MVRCHSLVAGLITVQMGLLKERIVGLMTLVSRISLMTKCRPSVPCFKLVLGSIYHLDWGKESYQCPFGKSYQEGQEPGLFRVAWHCVSTSMPIRGRERTRGAAARGRLLR